MEESKHSAASTTDESSQNTIIRAVRTVLLAGVGAVALGKEEVEAIINRLVEKGELAERDGRQLIGELVDKRKKETPKIEEKIEGTLDTRVHGILGRMNAPSKTEMDNLTRRINLLAERVEALSQRLSK